MDEAFVRRVIEAQEGAVAFDIGAHHGIYTMLLAKRFGKVYAFEPDPRNLSVLRDQVKHLDNVIIVSPMAISNKTGKQTLFFSDLTEANSLNEEMLKLPGIGWSLTDQQQVTCVTIGTSSSWWVDGTSPSSTSTKSTPAQGPSRCRSRRVQQAGEW